MPGRGSVPLWGLSHASLTFDGLRAKPTSLEYLHSIFRAARGYLINLFLLLIINKTTLLRTLGMTDAEAPWKPYWFSIAKGTMQTLSFLGCIVLYLTLWQYSLYNPSVETTKLSCIRSHQMLLDYCQVYWQHRNVYRMVYYMFAWSFSRFTVW